MLFQVCDHYYDNIYDLSYGDYYNIFNYNILKNQILKKTLSDINFCFVCYELNNDNMCKPMQLINQNIFLKICNCNGWIHDNCLKKWLIKNKKCPICRSNVNVYKNTNFIEIYVEYKEKYIYKFLNLLNKYFYYYLRFIFFTTTIYFSINLFLYIVKSFIFYLL
jgi:hypothetical protein